MNVMLVVPWDQEYGGVASVVGNLARRFERCGHRVVFFHPGVPERVRRRTTVWGFTGYEVNLRAPFARDHPVKSVAAFVLYFVRTLYQIGLVIRAHQIQIVGIHYPVESFVYFAILRWLVPIRLAVSLHGADVFPGGERVGRYPWSLRLLVASSDVLITASRAFLADCLSIFPRARKKSVVIHNGVDIEEFGQGDEGRAELEPYLLCIAAHNRKKAVDVLLKAFAEIGQACNGLRLLLVGDGPLRRQHEELARSLSLEDRVRFLGTRGRTEIRRLLLGCTVFVLPSRSEPFGMVVTEALACHKAVVASAVGGIPEIIENGRSGLLVEPDDPRALAQALLRVLGNDSLRASIAEGGYRRVRDTFGCERMSARYESVYSALLNGGTPSGA